MQPCHSAVVIVVKDSASINKRKDTRIRVVWQPVYLMNTNNEHYVDYIGFVMFKQFLKCSFLLLNES